MAKVAKKKVISRKKAVKRRVSKKATVRRAAKKAAARRTPKPLTVRRKVATKKAAKKKLAIKRNPIKTKYWLSIKPERSYEKVKKYFDGSEMIADKKKAAFFEDKQHAIKIARKLAETLRRPVSLETQKVMVKKN